jgi:hypothetical protein
MTTPTTTNGSCRCSPAARAAPGDGHRLRNVSPPPAAGTRSLGSRRTERQGVPAPGGVGKGLEHAARTVSAAVRVRAPEPDSDAGLEYRPGTDAQDCRPGLGRDTACRARRRRPGGRAVGRLPRVPLRDLSPARDDARQIDQSQSPATPLLPTSSTRSWPGIGRWPKCWPLRQRRRRAGGKPLIVGIMGSGHLRFGHGVPHQLRDLGVRSIGTLLPMAASSPCEELGPGLADAVFMVPTPPLVPIAPPRLGVALESKDGEDTDRQREQGLAWPRKAVCRMATRYIQQQNY